METAAVASQPPRRDARSVAIGGLLFLAVAMAALTWAKWLPYEHKLAALFSTHVWTGKDVLAEAGTAGSAPSIAGAWAFTRAYALAIWPALVAGLTIAAAIDALLPRRWMAQVMCPQGSCRGSLIGGVLALPSLMCTCCTAPVAATLRRDGASRSATLAYWVGNPVLNPAVLAFLALVAPWQWVATRIVVGALLVFGATALVARLTGERAAPAPALPAPPPPVAAHSLAPAPRRFAGSLARLGITLVPEYALAVFAAGLLRGWLLPLGAGASHWGLLAVLAAAVLGTLMVIPTAGEIPILLGLSAAGVGLGTIGALLITLPAISAVSMTMVARSLSLRTTVAMAGAVAACGFAGAALLAALG